MPPEDYIVYKYINDFANVLDKENPAFLLLEEDFENCYSLGGDQIVTIIIPDMGERKSLKHLAMKYFRENKFGDKKKNNGVLLLISAKEKKLRIIVGKGVEDKYPIKYLRKIIDNKMRTLLNIGDYKGLLDYWSQCSIDNTVLEENKKKEKKERFLLLAILILVGIFIGVILLLILKTIIEFDYFLSFGILSLTLFWIVIKQLFNNRETKKAKENAVVWSLFIFLIIGGLFTFGRMIYLYDQFPEKFEQSTSSYSIEKEDKEYERNESSSSSYESPRSVGGGGSTNGHSYGD